MIYEFNFTETYEYKKMKICKTYALNLLKKKLSKLKNIFSTVSVLENSVFRIPDLSFYTFFKIERFGKKTLVKNVYLRDNDHHFYL